MAARACGERAAAHTCDGVQCYRAGLSVYVAEAKNVEECMHRMLAWAFTPATGLRSSAMAEVLHAVTHDRGMFPHKIDTGMGLFS